MEEHHSHLCFLQSHRETRLGLAEHRSHRDHQSHHAPVQRQLLAQMAVLLERGMVYLRLGQSEEQDLQMEHDNLQVP
jgi:hypothetical protein